MSGKPVGSGRAGSDDYDVRCHRSPWDPVPRSQRPITGNWVPIEAGRQGSILVGTLRTVLIFAARSRPKPTERGKWEPTARLPLVDGLNVPSSTPVLPCVRKPHTVSIVWTLQGRPSSTPTHA